MDSRRPTTTKLSSLLLYPATLLRAAWLARRWKSARDAPSLVGQVGSVERTLEPEGFVLVRGELWPARLRRGTRAERGECSVRVVGARGCLLEVEALACEGISGSESDV
jgi:membrane-bound serine protease (ClpP class)